METNKTEINPLQGEVSGKPNDTAQLRAENQSAGGNEAAPGGALAGVPRSAFSAQKELRKNAAGQSAMLRKQADRIDKRMLDLPTDLPDYIYKYILWN